MTKKTLSILGATGSVGRQAADVAEEGGYTVKMLSAGRNAVEMANLAGRLSPEVCIMEDEAAADELRSLLVGTNVKVYSGEKSLLSYLREEAADVTVHSIAGLAGTPSALVAAETSTRLAIANKEAVIAAGELIRENLLKSGGEMIPVDSEHSAIFQCLTTEGTPRLFEGCSAVQRIILTASGGPFFGMKREELDFITPEAALAHPTWKMGPKITIDCATLMNKGFEIIEAARLFHVDIDKIEVLVHRQSIIHSMVEYIDTTVMAQLGTPDMRHCVRYALTYPERMTVKEPGLDFPALARLTFDAPDREAFPLLDTAVSAYKMGTTAPAALIAADEEAVSAFIGGKIGFTAISDTVAEAMVKYTPDTVYTAESVFEAEKEAREIAKQIISKY